MPYITQKERANIQLEEVVQTAGQLNYCITKLINQYLKLHGTNYQTMNDIVGALEGAKVEFQRRIVNPYEDSKIVLNGDIYESP